MQYLWSRTRTTCWNKYLEDGQVKAGFSTSEVDPFLFYCGSIIFSFMFMIVYYLAPVTQQLMKPFRPLLPEQTGGKQFTMEDQGQVNDFLWIKVCQQANRTT